jgi:hypothetical protein
MTEDIASRDYEAEIYLLKTEIKRLEAENLNLRCCGNCKWCNAGKDDNCYDAQNNICDRWKSDGLTQEQRK